MKTKYYRGEPEVYAAPCVPGIFRTEAMARSIECESNYYREALSRMKDISIIRGISNEIVDKEDTFVLKCIGVLQHYGFLTRLLDVTSKIEVAEYFACCKCFDKDAKIYIYIENDVTTIKDTKAQRIIRKLDCIYNYKKYKGKCFNEVFGKNVNKKTLTDSIVVDLKNALGINANNARYEAQKGAFILFGLELTKEGIIVDNIDSYLNSEKDVVPSESRIIPASKKIDNLWELSQQGINFVKLFPDDSFSLELVSKQIELTKCDPSKYKMFIQDALMKIGIDKSKAECLGETIYTHIDYIKGHENVFYFIFKEYVDYLCSQGEPGKLDQMIKNEIEGKKS